MPLYEQEFKEYLEDKLHPIGSVLQNPYRRENLRTLFASREEQGDLFGNPLDKLLDKLLEKTRVGMGLYSRWRQQIGSKERELSVPIPPLNQFISGYLVYLINEISAHPNCHGGEENWSARSSLESHLPVNAALSFDMENAFNNASVTLVFGFFYNLLEGRFEYYEERRDIAGFLSMICTVNYGNIRALPQGSPASMPLFNRIMDPLDAELTEATSRRGMAFSRWVDDFTVTSGNERQVEDFLGAVDLVMEKFPVAQKKVFFQNDGPIYLLGHKIVRGRILKNSREEREMNKCPPLNFEYWFNGNKKYEQWRQNI